MLHAGRGRVAAVAAGLSLLLGPPIWARLRTAPLAIEDHQLVAWKLAAVTLVLALVVAALAGASRLGRRRADDLLVLAAALSVGIWFDFGFMHGRAVIHHWEQFHYFLGSRYYAELGYDGLYVASLGDQADHDEKGQVPEYVRDLRTNEVVPVVQVLPHMREVYARFTPERWQEFSRDHHFFLDSDCWNYLAAIRLDHGYNASPTWTFVAQMLGRWRPASLGWLGALATVDLALLLLTFTLIFRTFGLRTGCLALVLFGCNYLSDFQYVGGSLLRFDWFAAVGIALCMFERRRPAAAGALLGYAIAVRVFPALFLFGPGVLAARALLRGERPRWVLPFGAGLAASLALCVAAGSAAGRGFQAWPEFAAKIHSHAALWLTNNVGLEDVVLYDRDIATRKNVDFSLPEPWIHVQKTIAERRVDRHVLMEGLRAAFLLALAAAAWRATLVESTVAGMVAIFALLVPSHYYWVMLTFAAMRPRSGIVLWVLVASQLARVLHLLSPSFEMRYGAFSWALALMFAAWLAPDVAATLRSAWADLRRRYAPLAGTAASR